jgi:hypothetical protein
MPENFGWAFLLAGNQLAVSSYCLRSGQSVSICEYPGIETALCVLEGEICIYDWKEEVALGSGSDFMGHGCPAIVRCSAIVTLAAVGAAAHAS